MEPEFQTAGCLIATLIVFTSGDFSTPSLVHMQDAPGTKVMRAKRTAMTCEARDLARGGEVDIRTNHVAALQAMHQFREFQRDEHHAGGMAGMNHTP
jgi:hypothetical protein